MDIFKVYLLIMSIVTIILGCLVLVKKMPVIVLAITSVILAVCLLIYLFSKNKI